MATLLDFRRRIRSVKNTQQITRAMKFVAASRLRRAQERVIAMRPYAAALREVLRSAMAHLVDVDEEHLHPLLRRRPERKVLVLVTAGERGLAGGFNANILRRAFEFLAEHSDREIQLIALGKKSRDALRKRYGKLAGEYIDVTTLADRAKAAEIARVVMGLYDAAEIDAVYLIYNEFKTILTPVQRVERLLPLEVEPAPAAAGAPGAAAAASAATQVDFLYEQPPEEIFSQLVPRYVETQIYRMLAESSAAEHAARMTAMDSATNNAEDVIDQLTLHMNKVRQAAITREIIEVVSGSIVAE
ncbi:MAG: ATP synthase F1 subunit gamma [Candidatus Acidiferrales bacterium]|jgi:F-type H+-transporting ATPase subunit gamma